MVIAEFYTLPIDIRSLDLIMRNFDGYIFYCHVFDVFNQSISIRFINPRTHHFYHLSSLYKVEYFKYSTENYFVVNFPENVYQITNAL